MKLLADQRDDPPKKRSDRSPEEMLNGEPKGAPGEGLAGTTTARPWPGSPVQLNGQTLVRDVADPTSQPQFSSAPSSRAPSPPPPGESPPQRDQWGGKYEFLLSCIGYCVGLANVWRFPYLCYRNGGGVFLIPYFIMLLFTGVPLFLMELSLGQYGAAGPITVWKCCPLLKGIGIGMLCVSTLVCLYYNVIIAWTFFYLGNSFQSPLPWSCEAASNAALCGNVTTANSTGGRSLSPTEVFWNEQVLGVVHSSGLQDPGPVRWQLAICLFFAWFIIFLCMLKGIHSSGKVVYVTATFPYFVLIVLIIRGATLEGSLQGVAFYLTPDWDRLASAQVWNDAASQIFYSLGIGVGGLLSMASYNKFDNNVIRDTLVITIGNCATSFFAGFAIFSILGHMAWRKGVPVGQVADSGPGLAFVAYPEALALLPGSVFWAILFFLMLFMLGVDTLFGNMEGITTAVLDEFPQLRRNMKYKVLFLAALCFAFYLMGLLLITDVSEAPCVQCMWRRCGNHVTCICSARGMHLQCMWHACDMCGTISHDLSLPASPGGHLLVHPHRLIQHKLRPHHHHALHVRRHILLLRREPVLFRHHRHDLPLPSLVLQVAALFQGMLGIHYPFPLIVHPLLHLHGDVQYPAPVRHLRLPLLGQGPGRVHGDNLLPTDPHLGHRGHEQGVRHPER
uniref:Transporter n=1 Tax=Paramormyrops kingsleyae TaxID=1676925 RepID=A0A3B3T2P5_9TELE